mmetsp:Transcript_21435/g.51821  ORF Transcript_21435/g.51821 Transcript_21435/m.51821 type:complete len:365 (-) Transcript_21435:471-1565(-)
MKKHSKASRRNPAIKGYLPIRIALPPIGGKDKHTFTSFVYIKEHNQKSSQGSSSTPGSGGGTTLFIANAPANGPIRTDVFLRALFESYGDIHRVTVAQDPRKVGSSLSDGEEAVETFREAAFMGPDESSAPEKHRRGDGKFAHVVFTSEKEMKKALKTLEREISKTEDNLFALRLDEDRMEQLKIETAQLSSSNKHEDDNDTDDEDDDSQDHGKEKSDRTLTGIHAVAAEARRKAGRHISRQKLMQMCNEAMASFESEEADAEQRAKLAAEQPDEDGFIMVTNKSGPSFGATNELEEDHHHRRKAGKRNRKRKAGGSGADELSDFYRFQFKETRKKEVTDLKKRFEEDLAKVKKMKEERAYRPF